MSNVSGVFREGWHPKGKNGGGESWRGDYKGINQMAGWVGKGKTPNSTPSHRTGSNRPTNHISQPLSTLKDPATFGPPPKNASFHGGAPRSDKTPADRQGFGVPLVSSNAGTAQPPETKTEETRAEGLRTPFESSRTGSKIEHLLPPPTHQANEGGAVPRQESDTPRIQPKPKPSLPPRLPPRSNSVNLTSPTMTSSPAPTYESVVNEAQPAGRVGINQHAVNRLGKAGISVPGLGIGQNTKNDLLPSEKLQSTTTSIPSPKPAQLNNLQARFSRTSISPPPNTTSAPPAGHQAADLLLINQSPAQAQGTTLEEKQSAFKTAQSFHKDPSSVSLSDARSAASTANNFRNRHQHEIASGAQKASSLNQKYDVTGRTNGLLAVQQPPLPQPQSQPQQHQQTNAPDPNQTETAIPHLTSPLHHDVSKGKPPPPPPPQRKKPDFSVIPGQMRTQTRESVTTAPPPVPLGTKPSFG